MDGAWMFHPALSPISTPADSTSSVITMVEWVLNHGHSRRVNCDGHLHSPCAELPSLDAPPLPAELPASGTLDPPDWISILHISNKNLHLNGGVIIPGCQLDWGRNVSLVPNNAFVQR